MWKEQVLKYKADIPHAYMARREQEHQGTPEAVAFETETFNLMGTGSTLRQRSSSSIPALPADHEGDEQFDGGDPLPLGAHPQPLETMSNTPSEGFADDSAAPLDHRSVLLVSCRDAILLPLSLSAPKPRSSPLP